MILVGFFGAPGCRLALEALMTALGRVLAERWGAVTLALPDGLRLDMSAASTEIRVVRWRRGDDIAARLESETVGPALLPYPDPSFPFPDELEALLPRLAFSVVVGDDGAAAQQWIEMFRDRLTALGGTPARVAVTRWTLGRRSGEIGIEDDDVVRRIALDPAELIALEKEPGSPRGALAREVIRWADRFGAALTAPSGAAAVPLAAEAVSLLADRLRRGSSTERGETREEVDRAVWRALTEMGAALDAVEMERVIAAVRDEVTGLGPLEAWLRDPSVSDVLVVGAARVFVDRGDGAELVAARFNGEEHLRAVIERMVGRVGRRVDFASPVCDLRLPDGSRVNVVLPPVALDGSIVTIRRFRRDLRSMADLTGAGAMSEAQAAFLREAVRERRNLVISGPAGAGKTTLLNVLAAEIPSGERLITLEDAAELRLSHPHVVRLETRPANAEGAGAVTMNDLVVNALRMRPDRLIVGECRGGEALPMLQAMNTGHAGSMTTLHANSAHDALPRLEGMALLGAPHWPAEVVRRQIASALDLVIHLDRAGGRRRVAGIGRVTSTEKGLTLETVEVE